MKLEKLLKDVDVKKIIGSLDVEISDVKTNSNAVSKQNLFICLCGIDADGHDYVGQAEKFGAVAVITQKEVQTSLVQVVVKDCRVAMSIIAKNFYNRCDEKLKLIGVVGTNGKTTTSYMIYSILKYSGVKCGLIGTNGTFYNDVFKESDLTTPDPLTLHKILAEMADNGISVVVMEVSAHAIYLNKLSGLSFEVGVFTNLSQDHLDFFKTMDKYEQTKLDFFRKIRCKYIVTNSDNKTGLKLLNEFPKSISYGIDNPSDVFAIDVKEMPTQTKFIINLFDCIFEVVLNFVGKFNVYNALGACTVTALMGVKPPKVIKGIQEIKGVSGRLEFIEGGDCRICIDYAHTPDGLENVLTALKKTNNGKIICVFGCGGNRDNVKRSLMGEVSGELADFSILTTDNPRFEEPMSIIREIEKGVLEKTKNYIIIQDRKEAIEYAMDMANEDDTILIAGKGSEKYQEVLGIKTPYNDKDIVDEIMRS